MATAQQVAARNGHTHATARAVHERQRHGRAARCTRWNEFVPALLDALRRARLPAGRPPDAGRTTTTRTSSTAPPTTRLQAIARPARRTLVGPRGGPEPDRVRHRGRRAAGQDGRRSSARRIPAEAAGQVPARRLSAERVRPDQGAGVGSSRSAWSYGDPNFDCGLSTLVRERSSVGLRTPGRRFARYRPFVHPGLGLRRRAAAPSPSPRSPRIPGRTSTRSTPSCARWRPSRPSAGHRVVVLAPSHDPALVRESRRLIRAGELFDPDGEVRVLGVGELLPLAGARRGAMPAPPVDISRTIEEALVDRAARLRARPRAVRAQRVLGRAAPLALAQRRHLPRARRAGALDPGRAPLRRAVLRPARRAQRLLRGHARADAARLPGRVRRAAPRRDAARSGRRTTGPLRIAFCDQEERARAAAVPARAAAAAGRARLGGDGVRALRRRADDPLAAARPRARAVRPGHDRGRGARLRRRRGRRLARRRARRRACSCARSAPARCRSPRTSAPTRRSICRDDDLGLLFEPGDVDTLAAQLERLIRDDGLLVRPARQRPARRTTTSTGRASRRASRRSTPRSPRAATPPRASRRCARGSPAGR